MARKYKPHMLTDKKILVVDDNDEYINITRIMLENEGHTVKFAKNGMDALKLCKNEHFDLILVDYYMPVMTGEEMVKKLREFNPYIQVILQTGYAKEQPPRELIRNLDIQGYYNKIDGPEQLLLWVDVGLKAADSIQRLYKSRQSLRYILNVTPDLHKLQPLGDLLQGILMQISGLLGISNSFLAVLPCEKPKISNEVAEGFVAIVEDESDLIINAGTGKFKNRFSLKKYFEKKDLKNIKNTLKSHELYTNGDSTVIPLFVGETKIGIIYVDKTIISKEDLNLLKVFSNQAAVAIYNTRLYQMATFDPLTNIYSRGVFIESLIHELRVAFRAQNSLSILIIDIDNMKTINDNYGHLAGDEALKIMGEALHSATRQTDILGRIGGDEFSIVLQNSGRIGVEKVTERIFNYLKDKKICKSKDSMRVKCSIGACILDGEGISESPLPIANKYFKFMSQKILDKADQSLYKVKKKGGDGLNTENAEITWYPYEKAIKEFETAPIKPEEK